MATNAEAGATRPPSITSCGLLATERLGSTSGVLKRQGFYWCVELNWARFFWALRTISLHIHLTLLLRESCKTCFSTCDCDLTLSLSFSAAFCTPGFKSLRVLWQIIYFRADAHRRLRRITWPSMSSQGGLESYWMTTCCFRNIFLMLFWTYSWNNGTAFLSLEQVRKACSRKLLRRVFPKELLPISPFHFV